MGGEEAVNMGVNMGGGCGVCTPHPPHTIIQLIRGGGTPQNLMGGLSQNMGGEHGGRLKCYQKITVKEFDSKVAGYYKPTSLQIY